MIPPGRRVSVPWALVTLLAGLAGPPVPWTVSAVALLAALAGAAMRRPALQPIAAGLVALAGAPFWVSAVGASSSEYARIPVLIAAVLLLGVLTRQENREARALPRALPWLLLAVGLVEASRQAAASLILPAAGAGALGLALVSVALAGEVAGARRAGASLLALAVVGGVGLGRAGLASRGTPTDAEQVRAAAALGVLRGHADALVSRPALALEALRADPTLHGLARALLPSTGPEALLATGWHAEQAPLSPEERLLLAEALDAAGEGGRAVRVLRPGRKDPEVAWRFALMERQIGRAVEWQGDPPASLLGAPPETWRLPGRVALSWVFLSDGARILDFHVTEPLGALSLEARGQPLGGPAQIEVRLDHAPPVVLSLPETAAALPLAGALATGPHRLRVSFINDLHTAAGDRNAMVNALIGAP